MPYRPRTMTLLVGACLLVASGIAYFDIAGPHTVGAMHAPRSDMQSLFGEALEMHDRGQYAEAIALYENILRQDPENVRAVMQMAHTYRYWGRFEESEQTYLKAARLSPTDAWVWVDLGKLYRNMGRYDDAESAFEKAQSLDPENADVYGYGLGYLYLEMKRYAQAEEMFEKALQLSPTNDLALSGIADTYREMGRYDESEQAFARVFAIHPQSEAYLGLAWLYIKQNRYDDAVVPLQAFLTNIREKAEVYYALGVAEEGRGNLSASIDALERAVALNPSNEGYTRYLEKLESRQHSIHSEAR